MGGVSLDPAIPVSYNSLVIPYQDYMVIPVGTDFAVVYGKPTLLGTQDSVRSVIDVIAGSLAAESFTLINDEQADLQVAALGNGGRGMPLSGGYKEFYLSVKPAKSQEQGFYLLARYLQPETSVGSKTWEIAAKRQSQLHRKRFRDRNIRAGGQGKSAECADGFSRAVAQPFYIWG